MTTNQTIDGVPRELVCMTIDLLQDLLQDLRRGTAVERRLRALLDKEASGDSRAPLPQGEPVAVVLPEFEPAFEKWWEEDGQYCRAGGGSYEKTFAYRAYEAALADVTRLNPSL